MYFFPQLHLSDACKCYVYAIQIVSVPTGPPGAGSYSGKLLTAQYENVSLSRINSPGF